MFSDTACGSRLSMSSCTFLLQSESVMSILLLACWFLPMLHMGAFVWMMSCFVPSFSLSLVSVSNTVRSCHPGLFSLLAKGCLMSVDTLFIQYAQNGSAVCQPCTIPCVCLVKTSLSGSVGMRAAGERRSFNPTPRTDAFSSFPQPGITDIHCPDMEHAAAIMVVAKHKQRCQDRRTA